MPFPALLILENYHPQIFSLEIPWLDITLAPRFYGLFYALSIILGYKFLVAETQRYHLGLNEDQVMNYTLLVFLGGLVGGRTYEVIFEWSNHYSRLPFWEVFAVWHGGLAIHGGIIGGILAVFIYSRLNQLAFLRMTDISAIPLVLGQAIGRWGNFTNGEAAGPVTEAWTGVVFPQGSPTYRYAQGQPVHPTMIYESLGNFIIVGILWQLRRYSFRPGFLTAVYLLLYSALRSALTPWRMDNQFFEVLGVKILAAYGISTVLAMAAITLLVRGRLWQHVELSAPSTPVTVASSEPLPPRASNRKKAKHKK